MMPSSTPAPKTIYRRWVLPDDGIIDPIAVEIAAGGQRPVRLTRAERRATAARILAKGGTQAVRAGIAPRPHHRPHRRRDRRQRNTARCPDPDRAAA
jgi:hypothetical protein